MKLVIIDYGAGNIKSIQFAFKRLGVEAILSNDIEEIKAADKDYFPRSWRSKFSYEKVKAIWFR